MGLGRRLGRGALGPWPYELLEQRAGPSRSSGSSCSARTWSTMSVGVPAARARCSWLRRFHQYCGSRPTFSRRCGHAVSGVVGVMDIAGSLIVRAASARCADFPALPRGRFVLMSCPRLGVTLSRAHHAFMGVLDAQLRACGLAPSVRPGMGHVLFELLEEDDLRLSELSDRARVAQSTVTEITAKMEAAGLLRRRPGFARRPGVPGPPDAEGTRAPPTPEGARPPLGPSVRGRAQRTGDCRAHAAAGTAAIGAHGGARSAATRMKGTVFPHGPAPRCACACASRTSPAVSRHAAPVAGRHADRDRGQPPRRAVPAQDPVQRECAPSRSARVVQCHVDRVGHRQSRH
jgi:hypothetical protein